jgi:hypothetical protein
VNKILLSEQRLKGKPSNQILDYFNRAVELFPPAITELLPIGLWAYEKIGAQNKALTLARRWAYFTTRVKWCSKEDHLISKETIKAIDPYIVKLPIDLQLSLKAKLTE